MDIIVEADQRDAEVAESQAEQLDRTEQPGRGGRRLIAEAVYRIKQNPHSVFNRDESLGSSADIPVNQVADTTSIPNRDVGAENRAPLSSSVGHQRNASLQTETADDTVLRLSNEFDPIIEPDWDTVVYIGPPPQEHRQDDHDYEYIRQHFSKPYLMSSKTLRDTGSDKFIKFLGPLSKRKERGLKKMGIHKMIPTDRIPTYYIDLRPMQDEDEALLMITELTCTKGILSWHMSHLANQIPKTLINGRDDLNVTSRPHVKSWIEDENTEFANDLEDENPGDKSDQSSANEVGILDLEPEYSAIRHYMAIERLLHAMVGHDPKLNSAAKVWTYFSIAKFFDCATNNKITNWIYNWLFEGSNANFVQANPESAYRMALGMRSPGLLRASFAMLVGERALMQASRRSGDSNNLSPITSHVSVHGRTPTHLDDDEINRIDHAAISLTKRITTLFDNLTSGPLISTSATSELSKFEHLRRQYPDKSVVEVPYQLLREYLRGEIFQALSQNVEDGDWLRLYRSRSFGEFSWLKQSKAFADSYNSMPLPQRLLTQSFWSQLENYGFYQEIDKLAAWTRSHSLDGLKELAPDFETDLSCVMRSVLCGALEGMNERIKKNNKWAPTGVGAWNDYINLNNDKYAQLGYGSFSHAGEITLPHPDQELVRALQAIGNPGETKIPGFGPSPYQNGLYNSNYPYNVVASDHRSYAETMTIKPAVLLCEMTLEMRSTIMREVLTPGFACNSSGIESEIVVGQMDTLLCLNDEEWKYLPLWADGLDDGSGGVFAELDVPDMLAIEGFRGGKMGLGDAPGGEGSVGGSFSMAGDSDDFDEVMTEEGVSTVGKASRIATDGTTSAGASTVMSLEE